MAQTFDIAIVAQAGRLTYEAVLFAASLRYSAPNFSGRLLVGEPKPGPLWPKDPRIDDTEARELLKRLGATIVPFDCHHFGAGYPNGNKVEMLAALEPDRPFIFFDSDTMITGPIERVPFDFDRPSASMAREDTWPKPPLYGPGYADIWRAVYDRFGVAFEPTLDLSEPEGYWKRYMYFNAGWFFYRCAPTFAEAMIHKMVSLRDVPMPELVCQAIYPWLDQIALPVTIAELGGGRPCPDLGGLDGDISLHWRALPLLYARASDDTLALLAEIVAPNRIKKVLKTYEPFRRMVFQNRGRRVRGLFDQNRLPTQEKFLRNRIKR